MWPPTITPCECAAPGYCPRHHCTKDHWEHRLCRRAQSVFDQYERGEGPCAERLRASIDAEQSENATSSGPGLVTRAVNFGKAVVRHVADGLERATDAVIQQRLEICRTCPECDLTNLVCRNAGCGCFLRVKATWRSEDCPLSKWPPSPGLPPTESKV